MPRDMNEDPVLGLIYLGLVLCGIGMVVVALGYAYLQGWL